jgi:hypothetical protein
MSISSLSLFTADTIYPPPNQPIILLDNIQDASPQSGGLILDSASFQFAQINGYSTWDLNFTSWPSTTFGDFYYYSPDSASGANGEWKKLEGNNAKSIPNVRKVLN